MTNRSAHSSDAWRTVTLGEVADVISGQHILAEDYNGTGRGVGYLTGPADFGRTRPTITKWTERPKILCEPTDVLVTVKGAGVGKINFSPDVPTAIGRQLMAVRAHKNALDRSFLFGFLATRLNYFQKNAMGATVPGVSRHDLEKLSINLPALAEQQRLGTMFLDCMAVVEKARAAAQAKLEAALSLPAAIIREAQSLGRISRKLLGECLVEVRSGVGADWSRYRVVGATRDGLAPAKEGVGKAPERYKLVDPVTVFYNPMRILLGSIAMVDTSDSTGITSPDYVVVKGRPGILDTRWFYYWFRSTQGAHLIDSLSRGAVRERILFNRLAAGEIELPAYETQLRGSEAMKQVAPILKSLTKELEAIDALPATILRDVFAARN